MAVCRLECYQRPGGLRLTGLSNRFEERLDPLAVSPYYEHSGPCGETVRFATSRSIASP